MTPFTMLASKEEIVEIQVRYSKAGISRLYVVCRLRGLGMGQLFSRMAEKIHRQGQKASL